jgi:hypothetical protein
LKVLRKTSKHLSKPVFFNLGSAEPRGSAKIFLGSAKFLTTIFYNIWANKVAKNWTKKSLYWVMLGQVSLGDDWLGKVRYFLLNYKIWGSANFFWGPFGFRKFLRGHFGFRNLKKVEKHCTRPWLSPYKLILYCSKFVLKKI